MRILRAVALLAVVLASCTSDGASAPPAPAETTSPATASSGTEPPTSTPEDRWPGLPGPPVDGVWESLDEADVAGWMTWFAFADSPEHVYPIVTSSWGLAVGELHIGERALTVPSDAVYSGDCALIFFLMRHLLRDEGELPGCYVLAGLDTVGEVEWLRAFQGTELGIWNPTDGFDPQFTPGSDVTVQIWDVIDGSVVVGPDETAVLIPMSEDLTSDCLLEVDDPGLFFDEPNRVVMAVIEVASTEIVEIRCEQVWWD